MSGMLAIINASEDDYKKLSDAIANSEGRGGGYGGNHAGQSQRTAHHPQKPAARGGNRDWRRADT